MGKKKEIEGINSTWQNLCTKIKGIKKLLKIEHKKLEKKDLTYDEFILISKEISRLSYHLEVCENFNNNSISVERAKKEININA